MFQIPIYRKSFDEWSREVEAAMKPHVTAMSRYRPESEARVLAQQTIRWSTWEFNEVIAWVVVVGLSDMIKVYMSKRQGQRFHRKPQGLFEWGDKLTEVNLHSDHTNETIAAEVRTEIVDALQSLHGMRNRFVDFAAFDRIAPCLDWRCAMGAPRD